MTPYYACSEQRCWCQPSANPRYNPTLWHHTWKVKT